MACGQPARWLCADLSHPCESPTRGRSSVFDISNPFTGGYRLVCTGIWIIAGWALAVLGLSYYARRWVGQSCWRSLHRFTALFWVLGIIHSIGSGTDGEQPWFLLVLVLAVTPAAILLAGRLTRGDSKQSPAPVATRALTAPPPVRAGR